MMNKEKQIQEESSKQLIDELSKMSPMVISTAYLHAINYVKYGEDVTEKWLTAVEQTNVLEKAYREGYYDALQRQAERNKEMTKEEAILYMYLYRQRLVESVGNLDKDIRAYDIAINALEQQKVGAWYRQTDGCFDWYECSECGYVVESEMQQPSSKYDARTNFCPNCGAKMESEDKE